MKISGAVVVVGVGMAGMYFGTPHWLDEQECRSYDGRHCAFVVSCSYVGIQGWRKLYPAWVPEVKECARIMLLPLSRPLFTWSPWQQPLRLRSNQ